ncbi:hypothetical protein [Nocardia brasiliensis]|nr:hypothetical protein [Nocardia brasiliensis]
MKTPGLHWHRPHSGLVHDLLVVVLIMLGIAAWIVLMTLISGAAI